MRSPGHRVQILRYRPRQRMAGRLFLLLAVFAALSGSYWLGSRVAETDAESSDTSQKKLTANMLSCSEQLEQFQQQVMNLSKGAEIDAAALAQARTDLSGARVDIERLEQEAALYKSLVDGSVRTAGPSIHELDIKRVSLGPEHRYRYRLTFLQRAKQHSELNGFATITVSGLENQKRRAVMLERSAGAEPRSRVVLKFVYFQVLEGEFDLPSGFQPSEVRIQAEIKGARSYKVDRTFDWRVTEN